MDWDDGEGQPSGWSRKCLCGKRLFQPNSYTNHIKSCAKYKNSVSSRLESAKARREGRNSRPKKGAAALNSWFGEDDLDVDIALPGPSGIPGERGGEENPPMPVQPGVELSNEEQMAKAVAEEQDWGRGYRVRQPVQRFRDFAPTSTIPFHIPSIPQGAIDSDTSDSEAVDNRPVEASTTVAPPPRALSEVEKARHSIFDPNSWRSTPSNSFGLYKRFWTVEESPHDPDFYISGEDLHDSTEEAIAEELGGDLELYPFPNLNSFLLGEWYWADGDGKSQKSFRSLVDIITDDNFNPDDIREANWEMINKSLASSEYDTGPDPVWAGDGASWQTTTILLNVPFNSTSPRPGVHHYEVPGFKHRPLIPIITERLKDMSRGEQFHIVPTDLRWESQGGTSDMRVYGELYNSPAFLDAFKEIQGLPPEPNEPSLPRYVVALMFSSDATMLASFGTAKIWPAYMMYGNDSKYRRSRASLKLFEEVAYFQSLPDEFQDWYLAHSGKNNVGDPLFTHLNRELFQAQWRVLLDDEFVEAYQYGIIVDCFDNVRRRFYPRILTYSADYPERASVVGVRNKGDCPCPRCLVSLNEVHNMGTDADRITRMERHREDNEETKERLREARKVICKDHFSVNSGGVESLLKPTSLVPAQNAFSERLSRFGFDVYRIPAVDIMHEVEIGVWKSLFIQLLRLLEATQKSLLNILNQRFREVPGFGRDTIRRFGNNVSEMKQLAARDWEDLLQCAIPVFEALLPDSHGDRVMDLLFVFAYWHAFAKLRLHTDRTLDILDNWTSILGNECRRFSTETCAAIETKELEREYQSRKRTEARKRATKKHQAPPTQGSKATPEISLSTTSAAAIGNTASTSTLSEPASHVQEATPPHAAGTSKKGNSSKSKRGGKRTRGKHSKAKGVPVAPSTEAQEPLQAIAASSTASGLEDIEMVDADTPIASSMPAKGSTQDGRREKTWNINTPKFHALGDVASYIKAFGTTDSYSTQLSEHFHRFPKSRYRRTNKKKTTHQISLIQTRQARIRKLRKTLMPANEEGLTNATRFSEATYFIGKSQNHPVQLYHFCHVNSDDLAVKGFMSKLKNHLLPRVLCRLLEEARLSPSDHHIALPILEALNESVELKATEKHLNNLYIHSDRIYEHKVAQFSFTTYDCRRDQDAVNASTSRRDLMCLHEESPYYVPPQASEKGESGAGDSQDSEPRKQFSYARLLGVYHVNVGYGGPGMLDHRQRRFDFLWVRWYRHLDPKTPESGICDSRRPDRVSLAPLAHPMACGFVDPANVIRAAHIIPRFSQGKVNAEDARPDRLFSKYANDREDWVEYYVNPFVDRDTIMRFHQGMGVGHTGPAPPTEVERSVHAPANVAEPGPMEVDTNSHMDDGRSYSDRESLRAPSDTDSEDSSYDRIADSDDDPLPHGWSDEEGELWGPEDEASYLL